jgi:hypothetical protein
MESLCGSYDTLPGVLSPTRLRVAALRRDRILVGGLALIAAQLLLRAWGLWGSWFYFDDLAFMSQAMNQPFDLDYLFQSYGGHLMPGGFASAWALTQLAPYQWWPWALFLLALQALAGVGMLRLLLSLFGRRPLVLALLAGFLFYVFTLPAGIWWAAGVNQLPMLVALAFGLHAFVAHLRTRRVRSLVGALAWTLVGLAFYEKTLLVVGVYAIVAIAYFCTGDTPTRLRALWRDYRLALVSFAVLGAAYLALYAWLGMEPAVDSSGDGGWAYLAWNFVMVSFATAIIGGPLGWDAVGAGSLAAPPSVLQVVGWVTLAGAVYYAYRTRTRSLRSWLPLAFTLACNVILLVGARAAVVGPAIGLEYRYQPESAALFVIGVGLALVPLVDAAERNDERPGIQLIDRLPWVVPAVATVVCLLATVSSLQYVHTWQQENPSQAYFESVEDQLTSADSPVPLIDSTVPQTLLWSYRFPENTYRQMFRPWAEHTSYPDAGVDDLRIFDDQGVLSDVRVAPVREMQPRSGCGYRVGTAETSRPLNGPVFGSGWWVAAEYSADRDVDVRVRAGDSDHDLTLPAGDHTLLFSVEGKLRSIQMSDDGADPQASDLCVSSLVLGSPEPAAP